MYVQRFPKINLSWLKQDLVDKRNDVLLTVAAAVTSHSATSELVVATQSFYVHDTLPGEFFSWKTPLYHMHRGVYCGRVPYLLQWTRELFVFQRVYDVAMCYLEVSSIWIHRTSRDKLLWRCGLAVISSVRFQRHLETKDAAVEDVCFAMLEVLQGSEKTNQIDWLGAQYYERYVVPTQSTFSQGTRQGLFWIKHANWTRSWESVSKFASKIVHVTQRIWSD